MVAKIPILLATLMAATSYLPAAETTVPQGYTPERYERIWKKSPFTVASVLVADPVDTSSFADSLTLVGLITIGGKPLATVVANDSQETSLVDSEKPNSAGLQIASFVNDLDPTKVEVVLKKGDTSGTLHFTINETAAPPPEAMQPNNNNNNNGQPRRIIQPRPVNGIQAPIPVQPRVVPKVTGPVFQQGSNPVIRRRQLQLPGANPNIQPNRQPQKGNVIPPP